MKPKFLISLLAIITLFSMFSVAADVFWVRKPSTVPLSPNPGDVVTISGVIGVDRGTVTNIRVVGKVDGTRVYLREFASIDAGQRNDQNVSFTWTATAGTHQIVFWIDPTGVSSDSDRTNNRKIINLNITAAAQPNLRFGASSFSVTPTVFGAGERVTFHLGVRNDGDGAAGPFNIGIRSGGTIVETIRIPGLAAHAGTVFDIIWPSAVCNADNALVADSSNELTETNESDNVWDSRMQCDTSWHENKNVWVENIRPAGPLTYTGNPNTISATVRYEGSVGGTILNLGVKMGIVGGTPKTVNFPVLTLPGDETKTVSFKTLLPKGSTRVYFEVDPDRRVAEWNESDNRIEQTIKVLDKTSTTTTRLPQITKVATFRRPGVTATPAFNFRLVIDNKAEITGATIRPGDAVTVRGTIHITGDPGRDWISAQGKMWKEGYSSFPYHENQSMVPAGPDTTMPFTLTWNPSSAGNYTIEVNLNGKDTNKADNKDSFTFVVVP